MRMSNQTYVRGRSRICYYFQVKVTGSMMGCRQVFETLPNVLEVE